MTPYTRAVVRRGAGPLHIATLNRTCASWAGICGRRIPNSGTIAYEGDAAIDTATDEGHWCPDCASFAQKVAASLPTRVIVPRALRPTGWAAR